jgi:hypothetical protein
MSGHAWNTTMLIFYFGHTTIKLCERKISAGINHNSLLSSLFAVGKT